MSDATAKTTETYAPHVLGAALDEYRLVNLWTGRWPIYEVFNCTGGSYAIMRNAEHARWVDTLAKRILAQA